MPTRRYAALRSGRPRPHLVLGQALRETLREGYSGRRLRTDVTAGVVVGIVALPLSMALAIATGVPPQYGLYTAIVAGALAALLGGSRTLVTGPTAAFVAILAPIAGTHGVGGLAVASVMAGAILVLLGFARAGKLLEYVPLPVVSGFTAGIAVVLAVGQIKDLLGLSLVHTAPHFLERALEIARALPLVQLPELGVGAFTLAALLLCPRIAPRVPGPLFALTLATAGAVLLNHFFPQLAIDTIGTRFTYAADGATHPGIPPLPPVPVLPWHLPGPDGTPLGLSRDLLRALVSPAFAIALLGAMESLLAAVAADGMAGTRHDPNVELVAQGAANLVAPFFGGFAATGALARTAANVRAGGRSPIAGLTHSAFVLAGVLLLAPLLRHLPMAGLAALLIIVAWNMSDARHALRVLKVAPRSDAVVLLTCFTLTVVFDMVVAVGVGVVLAALLFMRRMAELSGATVFEGAHPELAEPLPHDVRLYEIQGPLFFGAAEKAMSALHQVGDYTRAVILDMEAVPAMDATGLVNLDSTLDRLRKDGVFVVLAGVQRQPAELLERAGFVAEPGVLAYADTLQAAVALAGEQATHQPARRSGAFTG